MSELFPGASRAAGYDEEDAEEGVVERAVTSGRGGPAAQKAAEAEPNEVDLVQPAPRPAAGPGHLPHGYYSQPSNPAASPEGGAHSLPSSPADVPLLMTSAATGLQHEAAATLIPSGGSVQARASWGWRGFLVRATGGLAKVAPGPQERAHLDGERIVRQSTWQRPVNVLIGNKSGGVGKTSSTVVLAGLISQLRGGGVAAYEVCDAEGALWKRAEGAPDRGLGELIRVAGAVGSRGELAGYAAPQTSLAHVIGSASDRPVLSAEDVRAVRRLLDVHYDVTVADAGNVPRSPAFSAAVDEADVLVVPTTLGSVPVVDALSVLDIVGRRGERGAQLAATAVVVINHDGRPEDPQAARAARELLRETQGRIPTLRVLEVPYDPHIGKGGEITLSALSTPSQRAWTQVGAAVTTQLLENVN